MALFPVDKLCNINSWKRRDSNQGWLGEKQEHYRCDMLNPKGSQISLESLEFIDFFCPARFDGIQFFTTWDGHKLRSAALNVI